MKAKIRELRQKRAALITEARSIVDTADTAKRALSQEEDNRYNAIMSEVDTLARSIEREEQLDALEGQEENRGGSGNTEIRPDPALNGTRSAVAASPEYRSAYNAFLSGGLRTIGANEHRALMAGNDSLGGFLLAPPQMVTGMLQAVDNLVYMRQLQRPIL